MFTFAGGRRVASFNHHRKNTAFLNQKYGVHPISIP
jgi:hypothetical protein